MSGQKVKSITAKRDEKQAAFDKRIADLQIIIPAQFEAYNARKTANSTIGTNKPEIKAALEDSKIREKLFTLFTGEVLAWLKTLYARMQSVSKRLKGVAAFEKKVASMSDAELLKKRDEFLAELAIIEKQLKAHNVPLVAKKLKVA